MQDKRATLARLLPTVAQTMAVSEIVAEYHYPYLEYFSCAGAVLKVRSIASKYRHGSGTLTYEL